MAAYLFLLFALLSRLALASSPHHNAWFNFTAVGGMLLYFGARRSWREMLAPFAVLMATDYFLTVSVYHYPFQLEATTFRPGQLDTSPLSRCWDRFCCGQRQRLCAQARRRFWGRLRSF